MEAMFENKTVLITGSSRGIGRATALLFARAGANVVINYSKSETEANKLLTEISTFNPNVIAKHCDISQELDVEGMVKEIIEKFQSIDILINNAAIVRDRPLFEQTAADWQSSIATNLIGQFLCAKYVGKGMLERKQGVIVNVTSTSAFYSFSPDIADYDAAKAGVVVLTKNLAKNLAPYVRVNAVAPGWVNTDINKDLPSTFVESEKEQIYTRRFAEPEEIAQVISFLASPQSSYINGTTIIADGGHD